jgi:hypothetical protein
MPGALTKIYIINSILTARRCNRRRWLRGS